MTLHWIDWAIVACFLLLSLGVGIYFARRAGSSVNEFFLSGRDLPWWLVGTSTVATTFAADTPLGAGSDRRSWLATGRGHRDERDGTSE